MFVNIKLSNLQNLYTSSVAQKIMGVMYWIVKEQFGQIFNRKIIQLNNVKYIILLIIEVKIQIKR